jgi:hypothetical protein
MSGSVYFALDATSNAVKIGFTTGPVKKRIQEISVGNANKVVLIGNVPGATFDDERRLHERFKHLNIRREWFHYDGELREYVQKLFHIQGSVITVGYPWQKYNAMTTIEWMVTKLMMAVRNYSECGKKPDVVTFLLHCPQKWVAEMVTKAIMTRKAWRWKANGWKYKDGKPVTGSVYWGRLLDAIDRAEYRVVVAPQPDLAASE